MTDSRLPTQFENGGAPRLKRRLAAIPSWMLSLVLHGGLIIVLAAALSSRRGGIVGEPHGDFRRIGIYVGRSGDGSEGTGGGKSCLPAEPKSSSPDVKQVTAPLPAPPAAAQVSKPATPESPAKEPVPQPESIPSAPAPAPTLTAAVPQSAPLIGPGPAETFPVAEAKVPAPPSQPATSGKASPEGVARKSGRWDGIVYETRGSGGSGTGGGPRGSYGTAP